MVKIILVPLLLVSISYSTISIASLNPDEFDAAKFNYLYTSDASFKESVDKIRDILARDNFLDEEWTQFKILFNLICVKMEHNTLDILKQEQLEGFRKEVERIASNIRLMELEKSYIETPSIQMTPQQEIAYASTYAPKVKQPEFDTVGNGLTNVFVDVHEQSIYGYSMPAYNIIEISLIWNDEDHPNPYWDWFYDGVRQVAFGRLQDIETLFIVVDRASGLFYRVSFIRIDCVRGIQYITFPGCYSSTQTWTQSDHYEAKKDRYLWDKTGEHPWTYVNTWNHMLGEDQNNAYTHRTYDTWTQFTLQHGNRMTTENTIQTTYEYINEVIYQAP